MTSPESQMCDGKKQAQEIETGADFKKKMVTSMACRQIRFKKEIHIPRKIGQMLS
jgi:hypothetical protein